MKHPHIKLHKLEAHGDRDLSLWRLAPFDDISCKTLISKPQETAELEVIDILYAFEEARIVYWKFTKFEINEADETSILHLIRLDEIITNATNLLIHSIRET